jgi:hypothetical protein
LNPGPPVPQTGALTGLRYAPPTAAISTLPPPGAQGYVNRTRTTSTWLLPRATVRYSQHVSLSKGERFQWSRSYAAMTALVKMLARVELKGALPT